MKKLIKLKIKSTITSIRGAGTIVLLFTLIPLILLVPLIAIDVNMYLLTKAQLQNSLDAAAATALNKSTDDAYRANKILKVITNNTNTNNYINKLKEGVYNNFKPANNYIHVNPVGNPDANLNACRTHILTFTPGFNFTQTPSQLTVNYALAGTGQSDEYIVGSNITTSHAIDGNISLELNTDVVLPSMSKMYKFFGGAEVFRSTVTVKTGVTGVRVLKADDFDQSNDEWFN